MARDPPASQPRRGGKPQAPRIELLYFTTQEMGQRMLDIGLVTAQGGVPMQEGTVVVIKPAEAVSYRVPGSGAVILEVEAGCRKTRVCEVMAPSPEGCGEEGGPQMWLEALREHCPAVTIRTFS